MRGFWPRRGDDQTGVTNHLNRVAKYVVSTTLDDPGWYGTTVLRGGAALEEEIRLLRERPGRDIVLTSAISLAGEVVQKGLVDELRLFVYPVVLGHGRRLFPDHWTAPGLHLVEQRAIHDVVLLR